MRLYTIGRSAQSQIVLNSEFCSSNHAELLVLDNGDMLLTDKGSSNGTYVNGSKIAPGKEVRVTRLDTVAFANEKLNWALVPAIQQGDVKRLISIGTNPLNTIQLHSPMVSRFHATVKQKNDGRWFICDHSSNGTSVNGVMIPKNQDFPIKKRDVIKCADEQIVNPIGSASDSKPKSRVMGAVIAGCTVAALVVIGVVAYFFLSWPESRIYKTYSSATAAIITTYYYTLTVPGLEPMCCVRSSADGQWYYYNGKNQMVSAATGFFISENGVIVTNLHVAEPWLFDEELQTSIKQWYQEQHRRNYGVDLADADITVKGVLVSTAVIPNGQIFDDTNAIKCRSVYSSKSKEVDLAIFQTMNNRLPEGSSFIPESKIWIKEDLPVGKPVYAMGFPMLETLQDIGDFEKMPSKPLQANGVSGDITQNNHKVEYGLSVLIAEGSSGSPVFDKRGRLVGVVDAGVSNTQGFNFAVKARYIDYLLTEAKKEY